MHLFLHFSCDLFHFTFIYRKPDNRRRICPYCKEWYAQTYIGDHLKICPKSKADPLNDSFEESINSDSQGEYQDKDISEMEHDSQLVSSDSENESENVNTPKPENVVTDDEFDNIMNELYYNDPSLSMHNESDKEVFVTWLCMFIVLWQYVFGVTDTGIDILIKFSKAFFNLISMHINSFSGML